MNNLFFSCMMINYIVDWFRGEFSVDFSYMMLERYEIFWYFEFVMKI